MTTTKAKAKTKTKRDRHASEEALMAAVGKVIARDGFGGIGINAVAREAGLDKVLIYRYFGDLPSLVLAYAQRGDFWPDTKELTGMQLEELMKQPVLDRFEMVVGNFIAALRARPITLEILAWAQVERSEMIDILAEEQAGRAAELLTILVGDQKQEGDVQALIALLAAALHYLVIRARKHEAFLDLELKSDKDWKRIERIVMDVIRVYFAQGKKA